MPCMCTAALQREYPTPLTDIPVPCRQTDAEPRDAARFKAWVKSRFSKLNQQLDGIVKAQSAWTIPDGRLKAAVRKVIKQASVGARLGGGGNTRVHPGVDGGGGRARLLCKAGLLVVRRDPAASQLLR